MQRPLDAAFEAASQLPPQQQEIFAAFLLAELRDDEEWNKSFSNSSESLAALANEASLEFKDGHCKPLEDLLP